MMLLSLPGTTHTGSCITNTYPLNSILYAPHQNDKYPALVNSLALYNKRNKHYHQSECIDRGLPCQPPPMCHMCNCLSLYILYIYRYVCIVNGVQHNSYPCWCASLSQNARAVRVRTNPPNQFLMFSDLKFMNQLPFKNAAAGWIVFFLRTNKSICKQNYLVYFQ